MITNQTFHYKKAVQSLNYFARLSGNKLNRMKALKLIWLADRLSLRKYGVTITGDTYFALENGPVPSGTRDVLQANVYFEESETVIEYAKKYIDESKEDKFDFISLTEVDTKVLSKANIEILEIIFKNVGHLSKYQIRDISHSFPEWKKFENDLNTKSISRGQMNIDDFLINVSEFDGLFEDSDENLNLTKEIINEELRMKSL